MKISIVLALFMAFILSSCSVDGREPKEEKPNIFTKKQSVIGYEIGTVMIDGHKYIYFMTCRGVSICPAKTDD